MKAPTGLRKKNQDKGEQQVLPQSEDTGEMIKKKASRVPKTERNGKKCRCKGEGRNGMSKYNNVRVREDTKIV